MPQNNPLSELATLLNNLMTQSRIAREERNESFIDIAESSLMQLLNITLSADLVPASAAHRNLIGVNLIDRKKKMAVRILWGPEIGEAKDTFTDLRGSRFENQIVEVFVYVLTHKDRDGYSQLVFNRIKSPRVKFEEKKHIMDYTDVYRLLKGRPPGTVNRAIGVLRKGFGKIKYAPDFDENDVRKFRDSYIDACRTNFRQLNFFGLSISYDQVEEIEIDKLFVRPRFWYLENAVSRKALLNHGSLRETYLPGAQKKLSELFSLDRHLVILGKPGAGKSLLIKYIISSIVSKKKLFDADSVNEYLPFRVELHRYNEYKKSEKLALRDYIVKILELEYETDITKNNLHKIFENFPTITFFDGLDEILNNEERTEIRNDIENFISKYRRARCIVTSRYESYAEVGMTDKRYKLMDILDFDEGQMNEYVRKWYALEVPDVVARDSEILSFQREVARVEHELKYNPLLLALILIIYRNNKNRLPTTRYEIFSGCTKTIVFSRDKELKRLAPNLYDADLMAIFAELGYWQFDVESRKEYLDHEYVEYQVRKFLLKDNGIHPANVDKVVNRFFSYAKLRSIYIDDRFSHKTFLEYFAASRIFKDYFGGQLDARDENFREEYHNLRSRLALFISERISSPYWAVVLEVLFCKIDTDQYSLSVWEIINDQLNANKTRAVIFFLPIVKYIKKINGEEMTAFFRAAIEVLLDGNDPVFSLLITGYQSLSLRKWLKVAFMEVISTSSKVDLNLAILLSEFALAVNDREISDHLGKAELSEEDEYFDVLRSVSMLEKDADYLAVLTTMKSEPAARGKLKVEYRSHYHRRIFFGQDWFNYIISFFYKREKKEWERAYNALLGKGFEPELLVSAASSITLLDSPVSEIDQLIKSTKILGFKEMLRVLKTRCRPDPEQQLIKKVFWPKNRR